MSLIAMQAGAGKTKLVSRVIDHFEQLPDATLAYFNCNSEDQKRRDPVNILRSYIKQFSISRKNDAIRDSIVQRYREIHRRGSSTRLNFNECENLLSETISNSQNPVLILDALDETHIETRERLLNSLDFLLFNCPRIKIFISSRKDQDIGRRMQRKANLELEASHNQGDIAGFIHVELSKMAVSSHPNLTQELRDQVMNSLLQRSEGMCVTKR